jgi:hypothetical protein
MGIAEKRWAQKAQEMQFGQLEAFQQRATNWRNGLTALTALLAAATVIKGRTTTADLTRDGRILVVALMAAAFAILLVGSLLAMYASFGAPGDEVLLSGEGVQAWERLELRRGIVALRVARPCLVAGVVLVALATGVTLVNTPKGPPAFVGVDTGTPPLFCGTLQASAAQTITVAGVDQLGQPRTMTFPLASIKGIEIVKSCPS